MSSRTIRPIVCKAGALVPAVLLITLLSACAGSTRYGARTEERDTALARRLTAAAESRTHTDPDRAIDLLTEAVEADPLYAPAQNNLGVVYFTIGELESARKAFERARQLVPGDPMTRVNLGHVYRAAGMLEEAITQYELVLAEDHDNIEALAALLVSKSETVGLDITHRPLLERLALSDDPAWSRWAHRQLTSVRAPRDGPPDVPDQPLESPE